MLVKICGIKTVEAADAAVQAGADLIGFVFAPSKRQIPPDAAALITNTLPTHVKKVGVFVNETIENMLQIAEMVGLDFIQLHGDEPAAIAERLPYQIIKAFPVDRNKLLSIQDYPCDYYLLDSPIGGSRGGNGTTFDWDLTSSLSIDRKKVMLAGGLTPANVQQAIKRVKPAGVDISSGVETNGEKDFSKIKCFISNAKSTRKDEQIDNIHNA